MPLITQAFVLGAGLGTRLRPLTDDLPKPLVPIFQKPLITFAFDHLIDIGITKFFVNTHHRPERFAEYFPMSMYGEHRIEFSHEPVLLETAGGIANIAGKMSGEPLLIYNGDILSDLPLAPLIENHFQSGNLVTLALRSGGGPKHIALNAEADRVTDIHNQLGTGAPEEFVFTGIYIIDQKFVDLLQPGVKRSVIPHFVDLIRRGERIGGVVIDEGHWWDVGTREAYLQLHRELPALPFPKYPTDDPEWRSPVHQTAIVDPTARIRGCSVAGKNCRVEPGAILDDTIVWPGSQIASRSELIGCIVRSDKKVSGVHRNIDI
ncbi:MAG: sugar phosphate nucleotidyltransferase [Verrucomicrobiota bacterium]